MKNKIWNQHHKKRTKYHKAKYNKTKHHKTKYIYRTRKTLYIEMVSKDLGHQKIKTSGLKCDNVNSVPSKQTQKYQNIQTNL